jgi:hypothetical protein
MSDIGILAWEEPRPSDKVRGSYGHIVHQLRQRPNEWALVARGSDERAVMRVYHALRRRSIKCAYRHVEGEVRVWARFVPGEGEA